MDKALLKKMKIGLLTLSTLGLLVACGDTTQTPDMDGGDVPVEDPADSEEMPPGGAEDGSEDGATEGDGGAEGETTDN